MARREERLVALRDKIVAMFGTPVHVVVLDARDRDAVMFLPDKLPEEFRAVDIVINNAGLALGTHGVHECDAEDVVTMIETNVTGAILLSRAFLAGMRARNRGHLVCMSSIAGHETYAGGSVYCATKHALQAFTNAARHDLVDSDVRVTSICPGAVRTEFSVVRYKGDRASAGAVRCERRMAATAKADSTSLIGSVATTGVAPSQTTCTGGLNPSPRRTWPTLSCTRCCSPSTCRWRTSSCWRRANRAPRTSPGRSSSDASSELRPRE